MSDAEYVHIHLEQPVGRRIDSGTVEIEHPGHGDAADTRHGVSRERPIPWQMQRDTARRQTGNGEQPIRPELQALHHNFATTSRPRTGLRWLAENSTVPPRREGRRRTFTSPPARGFPSCSALTDR